MADLFEQELECPTPNCLKLVYESTSKVVALPTSMNPGGNFDEIVSPYLTDQVKCPPTPNDVVWPGPSRWLKSFLGIAPTP